MQEYRLLYHKVFEETEYTDTTDRYSEIKEHMIADSEEIAARIEARSIVPMENRLAQKAEFIKTAKRVAEELQLDCQICDADIYIRVYYYFDARYGLTSLKDVIAYADDMEFLENGYGKQIALVIDYCTHEIYSEKTGIKLFP